jgi:hypothetical protein
MLVYILLMIACYRLFAVGGHSNKGTGLNLIELN